MSFPMSFPCTVSGPNKSRAAGDSFCHSPTHFHLDKLIGLNGGIEVKLKDSLLLFPDLSLLSAYNLHAGSERKPKRAPERENGYSVSLHSVA